MFDVYKFVKSSGLLEYCNDFLGPIRARLSYLPADAITRALTGQHADDERPDERKHGRAHHDGKRTGDDQKHANRERHAMPEQWRVWAPRVRDRVLVPDENGLGEPPANPDEGDTH